MTDTRIVITGAAGLVGQNLIVLLREAGCREIVAIDKHPHNTAMLRRLHPEITVIEADLAELGAWQQAFTKDCLPVLLHAQIGGPDHAAFIRNNVTATEQVLAAIKATNIGYLVHASSSVVNSMAVDFYTESKKAQEQLVAAAGIPCAILRPTLMFGWFDRKHLGWLARFMKRMPVFPIPGSGAYLRQPLYARDFCRIIASCLAARTVGTYNITGRKPVSYVALIRAIRRATRARTLLVHIPYRLFDALLWLYAKVDRDPPFTRAQLNALATPDRFGVIDWPAIFNVTATPLADALDQTFTDPRYSGVTLNY